MPFFAKADMDKICFVGFDEISGQYLVDREVVEKECERNNVLSVYGESRPVIYQQLIAAFCRYDRNIIKTDIGFTCILYDVKPRTYLE